MTLSYEQYFHKTYGCWLGKSIAGNMGGPLEDCRFILDFKHPSEFAPAEMAANDDLDVQLVWLNVLLDRGFDLNAEDLMRAFIRSYPYNPNEYGYGKRNYLRGILPPDCGTYANGFFDHSMGCPIRAEIWATLFPLCPEEAIRYARYDGSIDHGEESIHAEQFIASLESLAYADGDLFSLIDGALRYIPAGSRISAVIRSCVADHQSGAPWREAVQRLHTQYGHNDSSTACYNIGVEILALLYGGGDFNRTVTLAVNGGYDTDCTAATVGAILGVIHGPEVIPAEWLGSAPDKIITVCREMDHTVDSLKQLSRMVCELGLHAAAGRGLSITGAPEEESALPASTRALLAARKTPSRCKLRVKYNALPEIAPGESVDLMLSFVNHTDGRVEAAFALDTPEGFEAVLTPQKTGVEPGETAMCGARVSLRAHVKRVQDVNLFRASASASGVEMSCTFGLVGRPVWKVLGPFWNPYNFRRTPEEKRVQEGAYYKIPSRKIFRYYDLSEAHNNFIHLDDEFLEQGWQAGTFDKCFSEGFPYAASEDCLRINDMFGFAGCCMVYAFAKMVCQRDEEVEFHIGSTTPYEIWLNGELLHKQPESNGYSPYTDAVRGHLREGVNRIALKLIRYSGGQQFTMVMREAPFYIGGLIKTDMGYEL